MTKTFGLLIERRMEYGNERVHARVVSRDPREDYPSGCSSLGNSYDGDLPKFYHGLQYDGLAMAGFVSERDAEFFGYEAEYRDVYAVNLPQLKRMVKTMQRVVDRVRKDQVREPGDYLTAMAAALKLTFVVERIGKRTGSSYADQDWRFMSIPEGRNRYRAMIQEAQAETRERLGNKAPNLKVVS